MSQCSLPTVQKRNLGIVDIVVQGTIDATVLTTGIAGFRRMTGFDMRTQADKIQNTNLRRYCYNYLDFGERCADKIAHWCGSKKPNCSYHTYYDKYGHPHRDRIEDKNK
ncbi:hypothetical protein WA588_004534 [Blastocystis sp. NMH]